MLHVTERVLTGVTLVVLVVIVVLILAAAFSPIANVQIACGVRCTFLRSSAIMSMKWLASETSSCFSPAQASKQRKKCITLLLPSPLALTYILERADAHLVAWKHKQLLGASAR